ncbi:MAG: hypothetical protein IJZ68_05785 [Bacteroidaceae bacterium]|nr:hypothetical protein [Bacteroidaceae bacterium]
MEFRRNTSFCATCVQNRFPFFRFNLLKVEAKLGDMEYVYRSHGGWLMLLALLPVFWDACPFTWPVGLAIGAAAALVVNIITYLLFQHKINQLVKRVQEYAEMQTPTEYKNVYLDPELSYLVGVNGTNIALMTLNDKQYVLMAALDGDINKVLTSMDGFAGFTPLRRHISVINNYVDLMDCDGVYYACPDGYALFDKQTLAQKNIQDYLYLKLRGKLHDERKLFMIAVKNAEEEWYLTAEGSVMVFFTDIDARLYAQNTGMQYRIEEVYPETLLPLVQQSRGVVVLDHNERILYRRDAEHVSKILQLFVD